MKTEKRANRNLNLLMNNIWGILKSFPSILPFKFKLLHSSVIKAELWSTGTLHCKLKNDTSEPLFTVVENILLNHSNLGTTEGWNTLKYSLNRWPSLEVFHCNQCIEQQSQDSKQLFDFYSCWKYMYTLSESLLQPIISRNETTPLHLFPSPQQLNGRNSRGNLGSGKK